MIEKIFGNDDDNDDKQYHFGKKYKFKSLKVYNSPEWMFGATKKYRNVFDKNEVDYVRAEFAFYNKLFDEAEWEAKIRIKAFALTKSGRREICDQTEDLKITPDKNVVTVHKGWGTDKVGGFWKRGDYLWEAYIDEELVGSQKFHIEDIGKVTPEHNPYFDVVSLKLYNGPYDGWQIKDRKYLKKFKRDETQFVWAEFKLKNKVNSDYYIELFINFYDDAGQLKGQAISNDYIKKGKKGEIFTFQEGWGSKDGGSWRDSRYTVEVVFMDTLVAVVPFDVGDKEVAGETKVQKTAVLEPAQKTSTTDEKEESLEDVMQSLEKLIGLKAIKQKIKEHINYLEFLKLRREKGFDDTEKISLHSVFTGNPGTGKTTVVRLLGKIYEKMGLLSKGHVHEVDRSELVGEFIGQTAPKVKKAIEEARGGILFIDEAYALTRKNEDSKDYGQEVLEVLIKEMSDGDGDIAVMVAGYPEEMENFMNSNPGLRSRFNYYFHFDDYLPGELVAIAEYAAQVRDVKLTPEAQKYVKEYLTEAYRKRDKSFGNARYAYSIIDEAKMNLGLRLMKFPNVKDLPKEKLSTIEVDDVQNILRKKERMRPDIQIHEGHLREALTEMNVLVGLRNIKNDVNELVKLVRYYRETGKDVLNQFSLHTVFMGNPGTGKTTMARILGKVFKALGMLERGHVVETDREGLIAGYIGQTAIKTKQRIDEAIGGILFIDEAYALAEGTEHSYGNEAIEVLLKNMEDRRGEFVVIVAGYPDNMNRFLHSNPGLKSRFDRTFNFSDYSAEELYKIALFMLSGQGLFPDNDAEEHLKGYFLKLYHRRDKYFGNARTVRKVIEKAVKNQHLRMASMTAEERTKEMMQTLALDDVREFVVEQSTKGTIGFTRY